MWKLHLHLLRCSASRMTGGVLNVLWYEVPQFLTSSLMLLTRSVLMVEIKVQNIYTDPPTPITAFAASIITWTQVMAAMYLCSSCGSPFFGLRTFLCCLTCCYFLAHTLLPNFTVQWLALLVRIQRSWLQNFARGPSRSRYAYSLQANAYTSIIQSFRNK
jgi:hypothetical protein